MEHGVPGQDRAGALAPPVSHRIVLTDTLLVPLGLGLLGFIEPCTVGSSLLFVKYLQEKPAAVKILETSVFTLTRAVFIGVLGVLAALADRVPRWTGAVLVTLGAWSVYTAWGA